MKTFTFAKLSKLGVFDPKYGQSYWGEPNEQLVPVKFNSMNQEITADDTIEAEEVLLKTSAKGTDYHQLKKVKVIAMSVPNVVGIPAGQEVIVSRDSNPPVRGVISGVPLTATSLGNSGKTPQALNPSQLDRIEAKLDKLINSSIPNSDIDDRLAIIQNEEW